MRAESARGGGFLLIEVVLAMSILVLAVVGVYKIMQAALETTSEVRRAHLRDQEVNGVVNLLRKTLRSLPGDASVTTRASQEAVTLELVVDKSPSAFALGPQSFHFGSQVLSVRQQVGGLLNLTLLFEPELGALGEPVVTKDPLPPPLPLISDLRGVEWRFYDERTARWVEQWNEPSVRPRLIQFTMGVAGRPLPVVAVFEVPPVSSQARPPGTGRGSGRRPRDSDDEPLDADAPRVPRLPDEQGERRGGWSGDGSKLLVPGRNSRGERQ